MKSYITITKIIFSLLVTAYTGLAHSNSGGIGDGGGQAVVCRDQNGLITKAELLDLFEAKNFFVREVDYSRENLGYLQMAQSISKDLDKAIPSTDPTSRRTISSSLGSITEFTLNGWLLVREYKSPSSSVTDYVDWINFKKLMLKGDIALPPVGDSKPRVVPSAKGCNIEQVAVYSDGGNQVRFVEKIWAAFSETDKAALIIHEALYRVLRLFGDTNSDRTRHVVAHLFSNYQMVSVVHKVPLTHLNCWAKSENSDLPEFHFVVYPEEPDTQVHKWAILNFLRWNGEVVLSETKIRAPMDYFADQFNITAEKTGENVTVMEQLHESLLNPVNYAFSRQTDTATNESTLSIQTSYNQFNSNNALKIQCRKKLSKIILLDDGSGFSEEF